MGQSQVAWNPTKAVAGNEVDAVWHWRVLAICRLDHERTSAMSANAVDPIGATKCLVSPVIRPESVSPQSPNDGWSSLRVTCEGKTGFDGKTRLFERQLSKRRQTGAFVRLSGSFAYACAWNRTGRRLPPELSFQIPLTAKTAVSFSCRYLAETGCRVADRTKTCERVWRARRDKNTNYSFAIVLR